MRSRAAAGIGLAVALGGIVAGSARVGRAAEVYVAGATKSVPPLVLVALIAETGQALVWEVDRKSYLLLELEDVYRDTRVIGIGVDFIALQPAAGESIVLRLVAAGPEGPSGAPAVKLAAPTVELPIPGPAAVYTAPAGGPPAPPAATAPGAAGPRTKGLTILPEVEVELEAPALAPIVAPAPPPPPVAAPGPPFAPHPPAPPPVVAPRPAIAPPVPAPPSVPSTLSMSGVRDEVSAMIAGDRAYRAEPVAGGGYRLTHVTGTPLERVGLQEGDVVMSVNGVNLASRADAMRAYAGLYTSKSCDLILMRGSTPVVLKYRLVP